MDPKEEDENSDYSFVASLNYVPVEDLQDPYEEILTPEPLGSVLLEVVIWVLELDILEAKGVEAKHLTAFLISLVLEVKAEPEP